MKAPATEYTIRAGAFYFSKIKEHLNLIKSIITTLIFFIMKVNMILKTYSKTFFLNLSKASSSHALRAMLTLRLHRLCGLYS